VTASSSPLFLRAARLEPLDRTPVWFMRQAGRYMSEYRKLRERHSLLEICRQPELACEVALQPLRAFDLDAAILFADILLPLVPMGLDLRFAAGEGPVIDNPVRSPADVSRLRDVSVEDQLGYVLEAVRVIRRELSPSIPLIGFAGAPFTVACYAIEGGSSRRFVETKKLMLGAPEAWSSLMDRLTEVIAAYVVAQVAAGAQAIQLFDSWVGELSPDTYRQCVQPFSRRIFERLAPLGVPTIHFGVNTGHLLEDLRDAGGDVIGLDWRLPLDIGWQRIGHDRGIQGNLDPAALFAPRAELARQTREVLRRAGGRPGHIFNLGHGILPGTPTDAVRLVVDLVHEHRTA